MTFLHHEELWNSNRADYLANFKGVGFVFTYMNMIKKLIGNYGKTPKMVQFSA